MPPFFSLFHAYQSIAWKVEREVGDDSCGFVRFVVVYLCDHESNEFLFSPLNLCSYVERAYLIAWLQYASVKLLLNLNC